MQNDLFEKIELYLNNELRGEELLQFETQLKTDETLRQQVNLYKKIEEEMKINLQGNEEEKQLKKTLTELTKKYFNTPGHTHKIPPARKGIYWLWAAAAVLVLIVGAYFVFFNKNGDNEPLYTRYAKYDPLSCERNSSNCPQDAFEAYNNKNFEKALKGLSLYLQNDSDDAKLVLAKNICLTQTGEFDAAISGFTRLTENPVFKYQAIWYKALAYLKQNKKAECKKILETIPAGADTYKKAQKLLKDL